MISLTYGYAVVNAQRFSILTDKSLYSFPSHSPINTHPRSHTHSFNMPDAGLPIGSKLRFSVLLRDTLAHEQEEPGIEPASPVINGWLTAALRHANMSALKAATFLDHVTWTVLHSVFSPPPPFFLSTFPSIRNTKCRLAALHSGLLMLTLCSCFVCISHLFVMLHICSDLLRS